MSLTQNYPFDIPSNYNYDTNLIEVGGGKAALKFQDLPDLDFNEPFDSDVGFTYDSALAEFVAGLVRQKDQRPANSIVAAKFTTDMNANWGADGFVSLLATLVGSPTIVGGKLSCPNGANGIYYSDALIGGLSGDWVAKFKYTPNYTTTPPSNVDIFTLAPISGTTNRVTIFNSPSGNNLRITANGLAAIVFGTWTPTAGQEYTFEVHCISNQVSVYVDNVQIGTAKTITPGQGTDAIRVHLGAGPVYGVADGSFDEFILYNMASQTPTYTIPNKKYLTTDVVLPEMHYTGTGTLQILQSVVTTQAGSPRFTIQVGQSGDYLWWNGVAWVVSNGTYAQANDIATFSANAPTLDIEGEVYRQFKVLFTDSNTLSSVSDLTATVTGQEYSSANPTISPNATIRTDELQSFVEVVTKTGSDDIRYAIQVNGANKYWDGAAWSDSSGYAQTNTAAEVNTNASSLVSLGSEVKPVIYLHSNDQTTTPEIDDLTLTYDFAGEQVGAPTTLPVHGHVYDAQGQPVESAEVKARLLQKSVYNDEIDMTETVVETTTDADGYWELQLVETTNMKPTGSQYSIIITTDEYTKEYRVGLPTGLSSYRIQDLV